MCELSKSDLLVVETKITNVMRTLIHSMRKRQHKPKGEASHKANGCRPEFSGQVKTLAGLVAEYEECQKRFEKGWNSLRSLMEGNRALSDLETAVKSAALAEDIVGKSYGKDRDGKVRRHGHQRRIKRSVLEHARRVLVSKYNIEKLRFCRSFEQIFELLARCCDQTAGTGPLYIYDTALRIGAFSKKCRTKYICKQVPCWAPESWVLGQKKSALPMSAFQKHLHRLTPYEVEDFLCIYKNQLSKAKV